MRNTNNLETIAMKVPEETLRTLGLTKEMARTAFYEAVGVAIVGLAATAYAGYELFSAIYK